MNSAAVQPVRREALQQKCFYFLPSAKRPFCVFGSEKGFIFCGGRNATEPIFARFQLAAISSDLHAAQYNLPCMFFPLLGAIKVDI